MPYGQFQDKKFAHGAAARRRAFFIFHFFLGKGTYFAFGSWKKIVPAKNRTKWVVLTT